LPFKEKRTFDIQSNPLLIPTPLIASEPNLANVPLLIYANKMDKESGL
jgi:hypothetical protein